MRHNSNLLTGRIGATQQLGQPLEPSPPVRCRTRSPRQLRSRLSTRVALNTCRRPTFQLLTTATRRLHAAKGPGSGMAAGFTCGVARLGQRCRAALLGPVDRAPRTERRTEHQDRAPDQRRTEHRYRAARLRRSPRPPMPRPRQPPRRPGECAGGAAALFLDRHIAFPAQRPAPARTPTSRSAGADGTLPELERLRGELTESTGQRALRRCPARYRVPELRRRVSVQGARLRAALDAQAAVERAGAIPSSHGHRAGEGHAADRDGRGLPPSGAGRIRPQPRLPWPGRPPAEARKADEVRLSLLLETLGGARPGCAGSWHRRRRAAAGRSDRRRAGRPDELGCRRVGRARRAAVGCRRRT